jgi:hypothetical protein
LDKDGYRTFVNYVTKKLLFSMYPAITDLGYNFIAGKFVASFERLKVSLFIKKFNFSGFILNEFPRSLSISCFSKSHNQIKN